VRGARRRASGDLRPRILDAAAAEFGERGYAAAATRSIARRAGIAEGTLFNYFATKQDLFVSSIARIVLDPLPGLLAGPTGDYEVVVRRLIADRLALWERHAGLLKALLAEALFRREVAEAVRRRVFEPALAELVAYLERCMDEGHMRRADARAAALALVALVMGAGIQREVARVAGGPPLGADTSSLADLVAHGLASGPESG